MLSNEEIEQTIKERGLTAPRVTSDLIKSKIKSGAVISHETQNGAIIYMGCIEMANGFTVLGSPLVVATPESTIVGGEKPSIIEYVTANNAVLRISYIELESGIFVIGKPSASISPENDDKKLGTDIAIDNCVINKKLGHVIYPLRVDETGDIDALAMKLAHDNIWAFEGYLLASNRMKG